MPAKDDDLTTLARVLLLATVLAMGCGDRSSSAPDPSSASVVPASYRNRSAQDFLAAVFRRYRNASTYHDSASVSLRVEWDGQTQVQRAPLSVWLDRDRLYCKAYDVRLWSDASTLTAWIVDPVSNHFDGQVLRRSIPSGRPKLDSLLVDTTLIDRLGAGLAGPPPQLEWLFAAEPMKNLFHQDNRFEFEQQRSIDGHSCVAIGVDTGGESYRFWIDERSSLIRRVDLPPMLMTPTPTSAQHVTLSLELKDASFDLPRRQPELDRLPAGAKYVRKFEPLPPVEPNPMMGGRPSPFHLATADGRLAISQRGLERRVLVLAYDDGDQASQATVHWLHQWASRMPAELSRQVGVAVVVEPSQAAEAKQRSSLPLLVDREGAAARALRITPGMLMVLEPGGRIAWIQPEVNPDQLAVLGAIVADVVRGIDVPKRLRDQWRASVRDYQTRLAKQRVPAQ
ncbi:MAG: hypothetical protein MI861_03455 [Pirellulales bacterium]|nr:hypothetical protein [Pirellulales bacterium]